MVKSRLSEHHQSLKIVPHDLMKRASRDLLRSFMNRHFRFLDGSSNLGCYNLSNEQTRLIRLIKQIFIHSNATTYVLT